MKTMTVSPFKFKLKKVSSSQNELLRALYRYLPSHGVEGGLETPVVDALKVHVDRGADISFEAIHRDSFAGAVAKLSDSATHAVFGMDPVNRKAVCEIDNSLAILVVEKVLGNSSANLPDARKLSDTELGVLQYLLLNVLAALYKDSIDESPVRLRFDRFADSPRHLADVADGEDEAVTLIFRVLIGRHSGYVRLVLPDPFVDEAFLNNAGAIDALSPKEISAKIERLNAFGYVGTVLWAEAGSTTLSAAELGGIEEGDIVILDSSDLVIEESGLSGRVKLRVGGGNLGAYDASISTTERSANCEILGFHEGE